MIRLLIPLILAACGRPYSDVDIVSQDSKPCIEPLFGADPNARCPDNPPPDAPPPLDARPDASSFDVAIGENCWPDIAYLCAGGVGVCAPAFDGIHHICRQQCSAVAIPRCPPLTTTTIMDLGQGTQCFCQPDPPIFH